MNRKITNHPIFTAEQSLLDVLKPLLNLNITYFSHVHIDENNKWSALSTSPRFAEHYFNSKYYNADIHATQSKLFGKYIIWDAMEFDNNTAKMLIEARDFGHQHNFTISQKSTRGHDFYHFATHLNDKSMNQFYLNNIDLLEKFIEYFNYRISTAPDLKKSYDFKFGIDNETAEYSVISDQGLLAPTIRDKFILTIQHEILSLDKNSFAKKLTNQQRKCLRLLIEGNSAKQIARELNISFRTVEHHLANIREVTGCKNSKELIANYFSQTLPMLKDV